jgi:hypothetical protein
MARRPPAKTPPRASKPVEVDELKFAIIEAIVEKFDGRPLDWKTVEAALKAVNYEAKMAARELGLCCDRHPRRGPAGPSQPAPSIVEPQSS